MAIIDSFRPNATTLEFSAWPEDITGLERILLTARGDLQRMLSAFFAETISIKSIYANTGPRNGPACNEAPVTQEREVHLVCRGRTVCVATSTITLSSALCEGLFLDDKFAVGQMFRKLGQPPKFELLDAGAGRDEHTGRRTLWRRYTLSTEGFHCDIVEAFPDRDMFVRGAAWFDDAPMPQRGAVPPSVPELKAKAAQVVQELHASVAAGEVVA
ncbi:unnamed protein product [Peniophora sp. CBMAI 1063]|nr:unnamed protein product [Peniophora sp. CBMAI 1063]